MKNIFLITMLFISLIATSQETLTVDNNTVKISGHKAVHYIITNNNKAYVGEHLPILFRVESGTKTIKVVYNDNKKDEYLLKWETEEEKKDFIEPDDISEPLVTNSNQEFKKSVVKIEHKPILEVE